MDAFVTVLIAVKSPARQLLIGLLVPVCAKQGKVDHLAALQFGLAKNV